MASRIKKKGWIMLGIVAGIIDIVQFLADLLLTEFFAAPEIMSEIADPFIGAGLCIYLQLRGVDIIKNPKRLLSLLGVVGLEELTGGMAPAWVLDVWYMYRSVSKEEAAEKAQKLAEEQWLQQSMAVPLNQGDTRQPANDIQNPSSYTGLGDKRYHNGVGRPTGIPQTTTPSDTFANNYNGGRPIDGIKR